MATGRIVVISLFLASATLLSCAPTDLPPEHAEHFITVHGDRLIEGDRDFRFLSFNIPNLHYVEDDMRFDQPMPFRWPNEYEVEDALESVRQMGGRVVRTYTVSVRKANDPGGMPRHILGPGEFSEEGFQALDMVLETASAKGVRVIIPMIDNWSWWGGVTEYAAFRGKPREAFWTDPQVIDDFRETIRFVLERINTRTGVAYKDDPTILAWETGNELHCPHGWTSEIAAYIKELDPNHLVIDGRQEQVLREDSIDDPNIDFVQTHHYEKDPREMITNIRRSAAMSRGRKPYHVGEFGFLTTAGMTAVMDAIIEENLVGGLVWSLRFHNRDGGFYWHSEPHGGDHFKAYHWPGFISGEAYDEQRFLREMRRRAFAVRGMAEPPLEAPAVPEIVEVSAGGLVTWRGSAGANGYEIERAEAAGEDWRTVAVGVSDAAFQYRPLWNDEDIAPGTSYRYRVTARNTAGVSAPSPPFGPVNMTHRTMVDELVNDSRFFLREGSLEFRRDQARRYKEDTSGLFGSDDSAVVYTTEAPMTNGRVWAFAETAGDHLSFAVSADGREFSPFEAQVAATPAGDIASYGYWQPVEYRLNDLPDGTRYLQMRLPGARLRLSRVELDYGEQRR